MVGGMAVSTWSDARLARLFERYRRRYWPSSRRLRRYRVQAGTLGDAFGECKFQDHLIVIDVAAHPSDRELRATMLHEMAHAVAGKPGHTSPFWTQLEYLLSRHAPITVSFPELGEQGGHLHIIPKRFRRCRRLFARVYRRRLQAFEREIAHLPTYQLDIAREFEDAASTENVAWRVLWQYYARRFGFVDLDGRLLPFARSYRDAARQGWVRGRRFYLED
jgi:hypothetical protein